MSAKPTPATTVLAAIRHVLLPHEPFSSISAGDLDRIARASKLRYFAPGEVVLAPASDRPSHCFIVRQGVVRGERPSASGDPTALWELDAGDVFPLGALVARRGVTSVYRSLEDTFVLAFPVEVFDQLIAASAPFQDFCTRRLAHLLDISRARFQAEYASAVTEQRGLATSLGALIRNEPATVVPATPLGDALRMMEERRIGSLPVVDAEPAPRVAAPGRPVPVGTSSWVVPTAVRMRGALGQSFTSSLVLCNLGNAPAPVEVFSTPATTMKRPANIASSAFLNVYSEPLACPGKKGISCNRLRAHKL